MVVMFKRPFCAPRELAGRAGFDVSPDVQPARGPCCHRKIPIMELRILLTRYVPVWYIVIQGRLRVPLCFSTLPGATTPPEPACFIQLFFSQWFAHSFHNSPTKISRNSAGINYLRTLCRTTGGVPLFLARHPPVHFPFVFNHLPPLCRRNRAIILCFQQPATSFTKKRRFRTRGTSAHLPRCGGSDVPTYPPCFALSSFDPRGFALLACEFPCANCSIFPRVRYKKLPIRDFSPRDSYMAGGMSCR